MVQQLQGVLKVLHGRAFGDFKLQQMWWQTRLGQGLFHITDDVGVHKLAHRQVHGHAGWGGKGVGVTAPAGGLLAGFVQYPPAHGHNLPVVFSHGNELDRRNEAHLRVVPTHEGFEPDQPVGARCHLRLVQRTQLLALHRAVQVVVQAKRRCQLLRGLQ